MRASRVPAERWPVATTGGHATRARCSPTTRVDDLLAALGPPAGLRTRAQRPSTSAGATASPRSATAPSRSTTIPPPGSRCSACGGAARRSRPAVSDVLVPRGQPRRERQLLRAVARETGADYAVQARRAVLRAGLRAVPAPGPDPHVAAARRRSAAPTAPGRPRLRARRRGAPVTATALGATRRQRLRHAARPLRRWGRSLRANPRTVAAVEHAGAAATSGSRSRGRAAAAPVATRRGVDAAAGTRRGAAAGRRARPRKIATVPVDDDATRNPFGPVARAAGRRRRRAHLLRARHRARRSSRAGSRASPPRSTGPRWSPRPRSSCTRCGRASRATPHDGRVRARGVTLAVDGRRARAARATTRARSPPSCSARRRVPSRARPRRASSSTAPRTTPRAGSTDAGARRPRPRDVRPRAGGSRAGGGAVVAVRRRGRRRPPRRWPRGARSRSRSRPTTARVARVRRGARRRAAADGGAVARRRAAHRDHGRRAVGEGRAPLGRLAPRGGVRAGAAPARRTSYACRPSTTPTTSPGARATCTSSCAGSRRCAARPGRPTCCGSSAIPRT